MRSFDKRDPNMHVLPAVMMAMLLSAGTVEAQFFARLANPQVEVTMTHPPGFPLTIERAAVIARGDACGEEFAEAVLELFARRGVELVDRQNLETILAEQKLGTSGHVDVDTAAELGRILGPAALVVVNTQRCDEEQRRTSERFQTYDGKQGVKVTAITEGFLKASVRVVDLATARIFAAQTVEGRSVLENASYEGTPEYPSRYDARDAALQEAAGQVRRMFFPWNERRKLYFFNDDKCNLKAAFQLLKIDDIEGAGRLSEENLELCRTANLKPKFLARAHYNLGMVRLLQSRYDEALELLEKAYRMDGGSIIAESIRECQRAQALAERMAAIEESMVIEAPVAQAASTASAASGDDSVADRLRKLESLLDQGLITEEEAEAKRQEILSEL